MPRQEGPPVMGAGLARAWWCGSLQATPSPSERRTETVETGPGAPCTGLWCGCGAGAPDGPHSSLRGDGGGARLGDGRVKDEG